MKLSSETLLVEIQSVDLKKNEFEFEKKSLCKLRFLQLLTQEATNGETKHKKNHVYRQTFYI